MEIFIYILLAIVVLVAIFVVVVATRPADFRVERSSKMSAQPSAVFEQVNDFHKWDGWSPWAKIDPAMKTVYEGPSSGTGAIYSWIGNSKVGQGRMTILESRPSDMIRIRLEFLKPFKATNAAEFTFLPEGNQTAVTWSMTGTKNFILKAFGLFISMDKMVGGDFEKGLAQMKVVVEGAK